jgi:carboxyl-terminal processing protease
MLPLLRARLSLASAVVVGLALAGCVAPPPLPSDAAGRLYARGLDDIAELYIQPESSHKVAIAGLMGLASLDRRLKIAETPGPQQRTVIQVDYAGQQIAVYPAPAEEDAHGWGGVISTIAADAKKASADLGAMPAERIDTAVLDGMTEALDRFSRYAAPKAARDERAFRDGFGGIGITLDTSGDKFRIAAVAPDGPAEHAGLRPDDRIVAIDGTRAARYSPAQIIRRLRGPVASPIALAVWRPSLGREQQFRLRRALIAVPTVTLSEEDDIAVLRIASFNQTTGEQVAASLKDIQRERGGRLKGIVLDLRGNPGGLLDQAVALADLFLEHGAIAATVGRNPASRQIFSAAGDAIAGKLPIVVLIDGGTASSSEIVAAALQDDGRAVVVGTASYGKGTVQTVLRLPNDGELTLTWALIVTPSGRLLNARGVVPNLCTSGLADEAGAAAALARAGAVQAAAPRTKLDDKAWLLLRLACPARPETTPVALGLAKRLLEDPALYARALHAMPAAAQLAAGASLPATARASGGLTGAERSLLSDHISP